MKAYEEFKSQLESEFQSPFESWTAIPCILTWSVTSKEFNYVFPLVQCERATIDMIKPYGFNSYDLKTLGDIIAGQGLIPPGSKEKVTKELRMTVMYLALFFLLLCERASRKERGKITPMERIFFSDLKNNLLPNFYSLVKKPSKPFDQVDIGLANVRELFKVKGLNKKHLPKAEEYIIETIKTRRWIDHSVPIDITWDVSEDSHNSVIELCTTVLHRTPNFIVYNFATTEVMLDLIAALSDLTPVAGYVTGRFKLTTLSARLLIMTVNAVITGELAPNANPKDVAQLKVDIHDRFDVLFPKPFLEVLTEISPALKLALP